jgi:hypothetical protein
MTASGCQSNNTNDDLTILYFPFLIASIIFTLVVIFGKLKKKATLTKGVPTLKS